MRNSVFYLFVASAIYAQTPAVTSVTYDSLSHSAIRVDFLTSASWQEGHIRYIDITANPGGVCTDGASGVIQPTAYAGANNSTWGSYQMVIGGLVSGHTYSFCPEVAATFGGTFSTNGPFVSVTMPGLPVIHPATPVPPRTFATGYPSDVGSGQTLTMGTNCTNLNTCLSAAVSAQLTQATTIILPAGAAASAIGGVGPFGGEGTIPESPDAVNFSSSQVNTTASKINVNGHGFVENQQAIFGVSYGCLPGDATANPANCKLAGNNNPIPFPRGSLVTIHVVDANNFQVYLCPSANPNCTVAQGTLITFADAGSGSMRYAKWPRAYPSGPLHSITVRTSTPDSQFVPVGSLLQGPPDGSGVPSKPTQWLSKMGNLQVTPGNSSPLLYLGNQNTDPLTSNIRFIGLHLGYTDTTEPQYSGNPNLGLSLASHDLAVSNITWDRCYFDAPGTPFRTGTVIGWNGVDVGFFGNYVNGMEAWHQVNSGLRVSGSGSTISIGSGSTYFGAGTGTLASNATITASGSQSSQNRLFLDFSMSGNTLNIVPPPGINVLVSGISNYHVVNLIGSGGAGPSGSGTNTSLWFVSPVSSTSSSCGSPIDFTAPMNTAYTIPPLAAGYPGSYDMRFTTDSALYICGVKFYKNPADTGTSRTLTLQTPTGTVLATATTSNEPASGWVTGVFASPYLTTAGTQYAVAYSTAVGPSQVLNFWRNTDLYVGGMHVSGGYAASNGNSSYGDTWPQDYTGTQAAVGILGYADITASGSVVAAGNAGIGVEPQTGGGNGVIAGLGPGPYMMIGNFISAAGLPWHFDNSGARWAQRGDYTVMRNYHYGPRYTFFGTQWSNGMDYTWRQPLEWKGGQRIRIYGDIFDGSEFEGGSKAMIALQSPGEVNCVTDADVMFNTFKHGPGTLGAGIEYGGGSPMSCPPVRTRYAHNISWDINGAYAVGGNGTGWLLSGQIGAEDVIVDHNTDIGRGGGKPVWWDQAEFHIEGVQVTNNILQVEPTFQGLEEDSTYMYPSDACSGLLGKAMADCKWTPSYKMANNVLLPFNGNTQSGINSYYPSPLVNYVPLSGAINAQGFFQSQSSYAMTTSDPDLHLVGSSSWCSGCPKHASDGMDQGANIDLVLAQQGKVTFVSANPTGPGTASVTVVQPDAGTCTLDYGTESTVTTFTRLSQACTPGPLTFNLTGLATGTSYYFRYNGAVQSPTGQFRGN